MFYENELSFLCDTFKKCHVRASAVSHDAPIASVLDTELASLLGAHPWEGKTVREAVGNISPCTMYKLTDEFRFCYIYLLLPTSAKASVLFIGPYLHESLSSGQILEIGERHGVPPKSQHFVDEYYSSIPVLSPSSRLFVMLNTFCERLWDVHAFSIVDVDREPSIPVSPINDPTPDDNFDDTLITMKAMEKRYAFENEIMQAVSLGQLHKETQLLSVFSDLTFEKRMSDPLRNAKNYSIIMNTILRKAAENGGVHPVYLDRVSTSFALKIEQLSSISKISVLMREMFRSYCRLVRKHSMKSYSPVVQKAILLIDSDLSAPLSLHSLAQVQNISSGYLSTVFKKETGKTVSAYIRERRVKHAIYLLTNTHLQIQTVALHCGIMDVQYFSRIFKKETGKTPKEYRETVKQTHKSIQ